MLPLCTAFVSPHLIRSYIPRVFPSSGSLDQFRVMLSRLLGLVVAIGSVLSVPVSESPSVPLGLKWTESNALPVVSLGYAQYRASEYDPIQDFYIFRNIRFAAPPVGNQRWKYPAPPLHEDGIQDGSIGYGCYNSAPGILSIALPALKFFPQKEDCLFLDLWVPGNSARLATTSSLPVLIFIFGGGYGLIDPRKGITYHQVIGTKDMYSGGPLVKAADNQIIYVRINYRLGAFGWLAGETLQKDGLANVGLHDQRAAFQWVQDYIHLFGGDPKIVTVMGESAGAGSIFHHIVSPIKPQFKRAIMQSPAWYPQFDRYGLEHQYQNFAIAAGCSTFDLHCLRTQTEEKLQEANLATTLHSQYGTFQYGPAIDGVYVLDEPDKRLSSGHFAHDVEVMMGYNSDEGAIFTNPTIITSKHVDEMLRLNFPYSNETFFNEVKRLYPPPPTRRYYTQFGRVSEMISEFIVTCNSRYFGQAFNGRTFNYRFAIPPALHGMDLLFTFFGVDLDFPDLGLSVLISPDFQRSLAWALQRYLVSFVRSGDPNTYRVKDGVGNVQFPRYGSEQTILNMDIIGFDARPDPQVPSDRCDFWVTAPYVDNTMNEINDKVGLVF
ncbi:Secreted lipase [Neolecta irregularis DAH-3]|uniref:Carboxylic ester hydrolase n=1 Tax=Neolecta irregularis (strain DAH-3) TaxID=1198029 RepID=A0A1U7LGC4_NEOID|nr:Secreted lipase [Neolecta irregularis DAH-3]|eukprot:OLL21704.1 Secreted lipase [Neolecta irregularis DAH-3]